MKKFVSMLFTLILTAQTAISMQVDTTGWLTDSDSAEVSAFELDLKSDLKNDFRFYQVSLINKTHETIDITIETNKRATDEVNKLISESLSFKELMQVPKQLAVESYQEDVGTGKIAKAHKGLIYLSSTAGAVAAGAGFLGVYPQQKFEEYVSHKKIKKEYKKITSKIINKLSLAPLDQTDILMLIPLDEPAPYIYVKTRHSDIHTEFHQL